jgi:hypothetical protein
MRRIAPLFLCLLLVFAGLCPALCLAAGKGKTQTHSCCQHKQINSCGHALSASETPPSIAPVHSAELCATELAPGVAPASVTLPPAPRPIKPPPPKQLAVLRV